MLTKFQNVDQISTYQPKAGAFEDIKYDTERYVWGINCTGASSGACLAHNLGHVWGIIWGMSGACLRHHLGHHLGYVWGIIWGINWGMSGASSGACLGHHLGQVLNTGMGPLFRRKMMASLKDQP